MNNFEGQLNNYLMTPVSRILIIKTVTPLQFNNTKNFRFDTTIIEFNLLTLVSQFISWLLK